MLQTRNGVKFYQVK